MTVGMQTQVGGSGFDRWRGRLERADADAVWRGRRFNHGLGAGPVVEGFTAHFVYSDPRARQVAITGELNDWGRTGVSMPMTASGRTGIFYRSVEFGEPARIEYQLIVDGRMTLDPLNPHTVDSGIGGLNSCVILGNFRDPPELEWSPAVAHGRVEEFGFDSVLLNNRRRVYVYLPPAYDTDRTHRFPTLYVHDGGQYLNRARLPVVLDNLIGARQIPPLVAVMVDPVNRGSEYRVSESYAEFVESELVPYIDRRFRTLAVREARAVMGASLGGLISFYLTLTRPHLFSRCAGQSSAFRLDEAQIAALAGAFRWGARFYLDFGKYELRSLPAHRRIAAVLRARGWPCFYQEVGAGHNWNSWRAQLRTLLTFLWRQ
jgi:enterochelin esterase-like enzyme